MTAQESEEAQLAHQVAMHPFLRGLPADHVGELAACAGAVDFEPGELLFRQGEVADRFMLVRSGLVSLEVAEDEYHYRTIQMLTEGDALGWSWLFSPSEWAFDARAQTRVRVISFDADCLSELCERQTDLGYQLLLRIAGVMADRLQAARRQVLDLSRPSY